MTAPGVYIEDVDRAPARSAPTDTGVLFTVGPALRGPTDTYVEINSMAEKEAVLGGRSDDAAIRLFHDSLETAFQEGLNKAYVVRLTGPSPVKASLALADNVAATVVTITADNPGNSYNGANGGYTATVDDLGGGNFSVTLKDDGVVVAESGSIADKAALLAWLDTVDGVTYTSGASSLDPVEVTDANFTGGDDDHADATDTEQAAAFGLLDKDLGPGQAALFGGTSDAAHDVVRTHANSTNRVAVIDAADTGVVNTLTTSADGSRGLDGSRRSGLFAPWLVIPGLTRNTTRTVPHSAALVGRAARNDAAGLNQGEAIAGPKGEYQWVLDVTQVWSEADRSALNEAGVNIAKVVNGKVQTYGNRTLTDYDTDPLHIEFSGERLLMAIRARAFAIGQRYVFAQLKPENITKYGGELDGLLLDVYRTGALYGETPQDAFRVNVGPDVNPPAQLAAGKLKASIAVRKTPNAEVVEIEVVNVAITEVV